MSERILPGQATHAYIGRDPKCGCMRAATVDYQDKRTSKHVAEMIAGGEIVERVTIEYVRTLSFVCPHETKQTADTSKQASMDLAANA